MDEVVGPRGGHDPERSAVRHGHEAGEVTLGGGVVLEQMLAGVSTRRFSRTREPGGQDATASSVLSPALPLDLHRR